MTITVTNEKRKKMLKKLFSLIENSPSQSILKPGQTSLSIVL